MDLEYEHALELILASVPAAVPDPIALPEAHRRILAETIISPLDLPGFDNSAVDGYAVRARDLAAAAPGAPVRLRVVAKIPAGQTWSGTVVPGTCARLFTGSALPAGADAAVMQEDTLPDSADPVLVQFLAPASSGEFVRRRGEDIARGTILASAGEAVTTARMSLLAAAGCARVRVGRAPRVAILATGSELKEPGNELQPGEIYESNRAGLAAMVGDAGGISQVSPVVGDDLAATSAALRSALDKTDAVITTGGVSVGELDFVRTALAEAGGELALWRVAIKPGRPFAFGQAGGKLFFGLPGNPVSALVTFFLLVRPALLRFQGAADVSPPRFRGVLGEDLANPGNRRHFMRVRVDAAGNVYSSGLQASHAMSALARANGLVDVPAGATLEARSSVSVLAWG